MKNRVIQHYSLKSSRQTKGILKTIKGEGISQRTHIYIYMHDPWTWTMVWGMPEGVGWGGGVEK